LDEHHTNIEDVIPNSKVVILPGQDGAAWKRQLFLRAGKWIPWVTVTVVVGTILLAVIVLVLHLNEKVRFFNHGLWCFSLCLVYRERTSWRDGGHRIISISMRYRNLDSSGILTVQYIYVIIFRRLLLLSSDLNGNYRFHGALVGKARGTRTYSSKAFATKAWDERRLT